MATQAIGGHGLTLNEAAYAIFYADTFKFDERLQAEYRNHRIGQTRKATYITLSCQRTIDERIYEALRLKGNTLESFMQMVSEFRDKRQPERIVEILKSL